MQIKKRITVTIEGDELLNLLVSVLWPKAKSATGKDRTLFSALGRLAGISDVEAVKLANRKADKGWCRDSISVTEFRRWLPQILSETFAEFLEGKTRDE